MGDPTISDTKRDEMCLLSIDTRSKTGIFFMEA